MKYRYLWIVLSLSSSPSWGQPSDVEVRKLSPAGLPTSDVVSFNIKVSPDGEWVVFQVDAETSGISDLFSAPRYEGEPRRLSAIRPPGSDPQFRFFVTPDSQTVVYATDQMTLGRKELWSVPIEGPAAAAIRLSPALAMGQEVDISMGLSDDGSRAWFKVIGGGASELWVTPVDGAQPPNQLSDDLWVLEVLGAGERLLFRAREPNETKVQLWSVPWNGSASPTRLNGSMIEAGNVRELNFAYGDVLSPDGSRVIYSADQRFDEVFELFSVPIEGPFTASTRLSVPLQINGDVFTALISSDSARVVYIADANVSNRREMWSVPIDGPSEASVRLNSPILSGYGVVDVWERNNFIVHRTQVSATGSTNAYRVPIEGPWQSGILLNDPLGPELEVFSAAQVTGLDEELVLIKGDLRVDGKLEWWSAPLDGSSSPHPLFGNPPAGSGIDSQCRTDSSSSSPSRGRLYFCGDLLSASTSELFAVNLDFSSQAERLSYSIFAFGGEVQEFRVSPDGAWVAYLADQSVDERVDVYRVRSDGTASPQRVHSTPIPADSAAQRVQWTPDSKGIIYVADHEVRGKFDLWIADSTLLFGDGFEGGDTQAWGLATP
ncbi:MAG: hypothetical protein K8J08_15625 [Thermoanaerobaculia bacterium]|nr:hypothetical protein [Thermoanaerobaculia bacterium]